jgi:hypothetical protein
MVEVKQLLGCLQAEVNKVNKLMQWKKRNGKNLPLFSECPFSQVIMNILERDNKCVTCPKAKISKVV